MASKILSIDIGERFISCASVDPGNPPTATVLAYDKAPINIYLSDTEATENSLIMHLQKILKDAAVSYKNTSLIIPDTRSYTRIFEMPTMTEKELISAIRYQADQFIPIPIDKVSMDIDILWEDKQNKKLTILLVAASNSLVDRLSKAVEKIGLVPLSLENETSASLKLFSLVAQAGTKVQNPKGFSLYLNFGSGSTSLCLFDNLRFIPLQMHNFSIGYDIFEKEIKANYSLSSEEAERVLTQS
jgi:type IV pilus assembly protein PilM